KGYLPGRTSGNTTSGGAGQFNGGSYGGRGGGDGTNAPYGDYADPDDWGAGGGDGPGGGLVRISVANLEPDGQILADAPVANYGGAGGGIMVEVGTLSGGGLIRAGGGKGGVNGFNGIGGGGGRVAVYAGDYSAFNSANIIAPGGTTTYATNPGGA